jgi:hypothetical protein
MEGRKSPVLMVPEDATDETIGATHAAVNAGTAVSVWSRHRQCATLISFLNAGASGLLAVTLRLVTDATLDAEVP